MIRILFGLIALGLLSQRGHGQSSDSSRVFRMPIDYCRDVLKMTTCSDGIKPFDIKPFDINSLGIYRGRVAGAAAITPHPARPQPRQQPLALAPPEVPLQDWRFS